MSSHNLSTSQARPIIRLSRAQLLTIYIVLVALFPPVYGYWAGGLPIIFNYFAADSFVYLSVAVKSQNGFYTYDGVNPTTGFHPLWQVLLHAAFQAFGIVSDKSAQMQVAFWVSVALVAAGGVLTAQSVYRWTGSTLAAMLTIPGLYTVSLAFFTPYNGSPWGFMNGMESPLSLVFMGLLLLFLSSANAGSGSSDFFAQRKQLIFLSLIMVGIVFSRLDDIFLPAVFGTWLLLRKSQPVSARLNAAFWFGLPLGAALLLYLAYNYLSVGHAMPVSGAAKSDPRSLLLNTAFLGSTLHWLVPDFLYNPFDSNYTGYPIENVNWRNAQMLAPVIIARALLNRQDWLGLTDRPSLALCLRLLFWYVIAKGLYNFLFVPLLHQGHWYYPISIGVINIACALLLVRLADRWSREHMRFRGIPMVLAGIVAVAAATTIAWARVDGPNGEYFHRFFQRAPEIAAALESQMPNPAIVELDDGIINYALGLPTLSGFAFAIDPDGYQALKQGRFLTEAFERGYRLIGSLHYLQAKELHQLTPEQIPAILEQNSYNVTQWEVDKFDFSLAYRDEATGAVFIHFAPKRQASE